jgi:hypothetical protein
MAFGFYMLVGLFLILMAELIWGVVVFFLAIPTHDVLERLEFATKS